MQTPIAVDFPLRGEWTAPNSPGTKVPSHGTDLLGVRYAYDFMGIDPDSRTIRTYRASSLQYLLSGVRLEDWFGWGQPIFSATSGTVVRVEDGWPERDPVHPIRDTFLRLQNARRAQSERPRDLRFLSGNSVTVETEEGYAVYAHAQTGSILVATGDQVSPGQPLARVGHSGNSTAPHLHFHLMDHPDPWQAQGIACCFREYEVLRDEDWQRVENGMPEVGERIRKG